MPDRGINGPVEESADPLEARLSRAEREVDRLTEELRLAGVRQRRAVDELRYRARNVLAVVRSILRRTQESGSSIEEFVGHFEGRLDTMLRYGAGLSGDQLVVAELEDVIRDQLTRAGCVNDTRYELRGPPVALHGKALETLALAIHELTINSVKFGALAELGRLKVEWAIADRPEGAALDFHWSETGVAPIADAPRIRGFGWRLIEEALPYQLGATTQLALKPGGVDCRISIPMANILPTREPGGLDGSDPAALPEQNGEGR